MADDTLDVGMLAEHSRKADWGPGRIVKVRAPYVWVFFRDAPGRMSRQFPASLLQRSSCQTDTLLDNLPPFVEKDGVQSLPAERFTLQEALAVFRETAPGGFSEELTKAQKDCARRHAAHELYVQTLDGGVAEQLLAEDSIGELTTRLLAVVTLARTLSSADAAALRQGLEDAGLARDYFVALLAYLGSEPTEATFDAYARAAGRLPGGSSPSDASWPMLTLPPFLAQPQRHMLLQPTLSCAAAQRLAFDLPYEVAPCWSTYEALCRMSAFHLESLRDEGARDLIDVGLFHAAIATTRPGAVRSSSAEAEDESPAVPQRGKVRASRPRGAPFTPGPAREKASSRP